MASSVFKRFNLGVLFILWRLTLFIPLVIGAYLLSYNPSSPVTYVYKYINSNLSFSSVFLFPWANFDGIHYLTIAEHGYTNQARFFPLFPMLIKALTGISVGSQIFVGMLIVTLSFYLALKVLQKLIELDFSKEISMKTILFLLIFPASFFFVSVYSESLFLLLSLLAFYFARKKRWILAILCGILVMTTRFVGVAILPALLYEFVTNEKVRINKLAFFLLTPLGLVLYSIFNYYQWGNFFYFITAQGELGNSRSVSSIILFPQTIYRYIKILSTVSINSYDWAIALLELTSFLFVSLLLYFAWKKKVRASYLIFALINFAIIISTGTFSGLPRYILTIFPIFIVLSLINNKLFKFAYVAISPILLFVLLMLFSRGYFVA